MYHALIVRPVIVILRSILTVAFLVGGAIAAEPVPADPVPFDISGQPLRDALVEFARQSDRELLFATNVAEDKVANYVAGTYEPEDALELLLADTGLEYSVTANDTILVAEEDGGPDPGNSRTKPILMAQNQASVEQNQASQRIETDSDEDERKRPLEEIIVTGTNIRGIAPESSPTRTFNREDIQSSGAATAHDFIQTLPFNFGGGSNAELPAGAPGDGASGNNNVTFGALGSSVNLRGLGSGSTLVLLNGHRVAPSSAIGDFTDISMIPASAIERVEVLNDGGSSIFGSDAVAGVVNFILRDDYDGAEMSFRYGLGTQNSTPEEKRATVTGGLNWDRGNAIVVYEYFNQDNLSAEDRAFSQGASSPNDLQPSQERHSVLAALSQKLTGNFETFVDFAFSNRDAEHLFSFGPIGLSSTPSWRTLNVAAGASWKVTDTWFIDFSGTYGSTEGTTTLVGIPPLMFNNVRDTNSDIWTGDIKASGTLITLPSGELKLAIGGQFRTESFSHIRTDLDRLDRKAGRDVYALFGEAMIPIIGPHNDVPGTERLEVNVSGRLDDFSDFGTTANPKVGVLWSPIDGLNFRGSYGTSFKPPPLGRVGAFDSLLTVLPTSFINDERGLTPGDPSIADVIELFVSGTGKNLDAETSRTFTVGFDFQEEWGRHALGFSLSYFDIEFENRLGSTPMPENRSAFDAPNIAINDPDAFPPGTVIFSPSQDEINDVVNGADRIDFSGGTDVSDIPNAQIITFVNVTRNLSQTVTSGFEFDIAYSYGSDFGDWLIGLDATLLNEFKQQAAVTTPAIEQTNTLFNPIELKLRGRTGYARNGFTANLFVNYTDDYRVDNTADAAPIDSWTTVDLNLAYDTQQKFGSPILNDTIFRLSAINLFDADPPSTGVVLPISLLFGFDPANASALGRFIAFEATKRF